MRMRWIVALLLLAMVLVVGCRSRAVVVNPGPGGPDFVVVKRGPPPAPVRVVQPPRPGPRYIWVPGHYTHSGGSYHWQRGHWKTPPRRNAVWVAPHYSVRKGHWVRGHWR